MGQKVDAHGFRLGTLYDWSSKWYADGSQYKDFLIEDVQLRQLIRENLKMAGIVKIEIERSISVIKITLYVSRPGVVIGRGGSRLKKLKEMIVEELAIDPQAPKAPKVDLQVREVDKPNLSAALICQELVSKLEGRYPHRRAVAQAMDKAMRGGAQGIRIVLAGRIAGAEISRTEKYDRGKVPLQTLRADIDYVKMPALTKSGYIGVKVWIYRKEEEIE